MRSRSVDRPRKMWIDLLNECLKKVSLYVGQARIVDKRNKWKEFLRGNEEGGWNDEKRET